MYCNEPDQLCTYLTEIVYGDEITAYCQKHFENLKKSNNNLHLITSYPECDSITLISNPPQPVPDKPTPPPPTALKCDWCGDYIQGINVQVDDEFFHPLCSSYVKVQEPVEEIPLNTASEFLTHANKVMTERGETYDKSTAVSQERSMGKTIEAFNVITGRDLKESEGWLLMLLLKQTRQYSSEKYHEDSALDSVAYSALLAEALANDTTC